MFSNFEIKLPCFYLGQFKLLLINCVNYILLGMKTDILLSVVDYTYIVTHLLSIILHF